VRLRELREARDNADVERQQASEAAQQAQALRLAAAAELALRTTRVPVSTALALSTESVLTKPTVQGDLALRHALRLHPRTLARLDHGGPVIAVAFSPDGAWVATGSEDHSTRVFEATPDPLVQGAIDAMGRPLNSAELRRYLLLPNCLHVERWKLQRNRARPKPGE
jgi:WD domain, G-beta repeat